MRPIHGTILCLINAAAYSRAYFQQLEPYLRGHGFDVAFALDSHLSDELYADGRPLSNADYFTDFCRSRLPLPDDFPAGAESLGWGVLYSDFDRFLTMRIPPPLAPEGPLRFEHVPRLLEEFFRSVFDRVRPVAVLYEQASNSFALAANAEALRRGAPFCSIAPARLPGRIELSLTGALRDYIALGVHFRRALEGRVDASHWQVAQQYVDNVETAVPDYMKPGQAGAVLASVSLLSKYANVDKLRHVLRSWRYSRRHRDDVALAYQHGDPVRLSLAYFARALARRARLPLIQRMYKTSAPSGRFLLYPLHYHPEASTSVLAPDFTDELHVIRSIAFRLPAGLRLVVKEHPSAVALQPRDFYRQLCELPNVELVAADLPSKLLARRSEGVICVTSTLGFEAAVMNKPVVCLGDVLYGYFPNVRMVSHLGELDEALRWALAYEPLSPDTLLAATAAYAEFTAPGKFDFRASLGDAEALSSVADLIASRLQERSTSPPGVTIA
jgi:hypothetical protein